MARAIQPRATGGPSPARGRRVRGLGSVFAKTVRDSRRTTIVVAGILAVLLLSVTAAVAAEFATPQSRRELAAVVASLPPILQGLAGRPVNVETMGGYVQYKYGTFFPIIISLWSIVALSGTLAGEARRGSLDLVVAAPLSRRRIALEKLSGHVVVIVVAAFAVFVSTAVAGAVNGRLPGDEISVGAAAAYAVGLALLGLVAGALAFALAQFVGRGAAIGISGTVMFAGFLVSGYQAAVPQLAPLANLTWFGWTANHLPLAGLTDWPSLGLVAVVTVIELGIGVEAFARRDIGATSAIPTPSLPVALVGLAGPARRAFGIALPTALAWGIGTGIYGLVIAASSRAFVDVLTTSPDLSRLLNSAFPGTDVATVGGFLQLLFVQFGLILAGLAAATLVGGWASDETSGRLEMLLSTPLSRSRWVLAGGAGIAAAIAVLIGLAALGIAIGSEMAGGEAATPVLGTFTLGLAAIAFAGIGVAVGGWFRAGLAGPVVAILTIVTWFIDIIAPALNLPDIVHDLALTSHYGLPMLGRWDGAGIVSSLVLGVGGVAIGAVGFRRRDIGG